MKHPPNMKRKTQQSRIRKMAESMHKKMMKKLSDEDKARKVKRGKWYAL